MYTTFLNCKIKFHEKSFAVSIYCISFGYKSKMPLICCVKHKLKKVVTQRVTAFKKTMYSSITKKKCKCGCDKWPSLGYNGYFSAHAPQEIIEKVGTKRQVAIKNRNKRQALSRQLHKEQNVVSGAELNRWFDDRRKEMTGVCANCGSKSCKESDDFFRFSIAHILPKAYFHSVKTHESNWIELCFWGSESCHSQMDNKMLDLIDMACFDTIITRFVEMYPSVAEKEKRRIPPVLMQYIEVER